VRAEFTQTLAQRVRGKVPWLLTDEEFEDLSSTETTWWQNVFIGGERFDSHPHFHEWYRRDGDRTARFRRRDDPVWIVDALQHVDHASPAGTGRVRDVKCDRFGFHVDLERHRGELDVEPEVGRSDAPHLTGEVWIDGSNCIRRVSWVEIPRLRSRFKSGGEIEDYLPRTTIELWDFGTAADIEAPEITRRPPTNSKRVRVLLRIIVEVWRRKRIQP
jgi:hypothetical protein